MMKKLSISYILSSTPVALSGLLLVASLAGCPPVEPMQACSAGSTDQSCPKSQVDMAVPPMDCKLVCNPAIHEMCNSSTNQCECNTDYERQGAECKPLCDVHPTDPKCKKQPDLLGSGLHVDILPAPGLKGLQLTFSTTADFVRVKNQGNLNAGAHKAAFGMADLTAGVLLGCKVPFTGGIAADETASYYEQGKYCSISFNDLKMGNRYAMFVCADIDKEVDESNEGNNCWQDTPYTLFTPDEIPTAGFVASSPSLGHQLTPMAPAEQWQQRLDFRLQSAP